MIAADYTGGIALGTLLDGVPIVGIHPQRTDYGAYFWGAKASIKWIKPSTDDLTFFSTIAPDRREIIKRRFLEGRRVLETVDIEISNSDGLVAEAVFTYWLQDTYALRRDAHDELKVYPLYDHRRKTSAKLISGLRALEQLKEPAARLFADPLAVAIAGNHGRTLAERFCLIAPQLLPMVTSRTVSADRITAEFSSKGAFQLVNIGVGYDTRHARIALPKGIQIYDVDIPSMLRRRAKETLARDAVNVRHEVGMDLIEQSLREKLFCAGFDPSLRTLFIWEGGSMYFAEEVANRIFADIAELMGHVESRLWVDYVTPVVISNSIQNDQLGAFIEAMRALGEPFINSIDRIEEKMMALDLRVYTDEPSDHLSPTHDTLFQHYRFALVGRR